MSTSVVDRVNRFINEKDYIVIDSSKRVSGSAENFTVNLGRSFSDVKSLQPLMIIFSNNIYNVTSIGNIFSITKAGSELELGIEEGNYEMTDIITSLNNAWSTYNLEFLYDSSKLKVTITALDSIPFSINTDRSTILSTLGFSATYSPNLTAISHTSDTIIRLSPYEFINIQMDIFEEYYGDVKKNYFVSFPASEIQFGKSAQILFPQIEIVSKKSFFESIEVALVDKNFNVIDNNNSDWLIFLRVNFL